MKQHIVLNDLQLFNESMEIGERVWSLVERWNSFAKETIGKQLVRAADSVAANIAEGYGRFCFKARKTFCYYSRGSLLECKSWCLKARNRNLIAMEEFTETNDKLIHLAA